MIFVTGRSDEDKWFKKQDVGLKPMIFVPGRSDSNHQWFNKQDCWTETNDLYYLFQDGQTKINDLMTRIVGLLPMIFVPGRFE